jgi:hypothetical protein
MHTVWSYVACIVATVKQYNLKPNTEKSGFIVKMIH